MINTIIISLSAATKFITTAIITHSNIELVYFDYSLNSKCLKSSGELHTFEYSVQLSVLFPLAFTMNRKCSQRHACRAIMPIELRRKSKEMTDFIRELFCTKAPIIKTFTLWLF